MPSASAGALVPRALVARAVLRATLRGVERLVEPPLAFALPVPERVLVAPPDILSGTGANAEEIYGGRFELVGHAVETAGASPFAVTDAPETWVQALHGFGWLRHAGAGGDALARAHARALAGDWFREHGHPDRGVAWEPMVAAARLRHWLTYSPLLLSDPAGEEEGQGQGQGQGEGADSPGTHSPGTRAPGANPPGAADPGFDDRFLRQIAVHRRYLKRAARDTRDPLTRLHVVASLAIASLALPSGREEQRRLGAALDAELAEQVLHDGGHVSRRASAAVDLLTVLMPLGRCYMARGLVAPPGLLPAIDRMVPALRHHMMGDGGLARHNGTHGVRLDRLAAILALDAGGHARARGSERGTGTDEGRDNAKDGAKAVVKGARDDARASGASGPDASTARVAPAFGLGSAAGTGASEGLDSDGAPLELPESGYQRLAVGGTIVVADTGTLPPPEHASRAHAGALSFEMSVGAAPLVVNLGAVEPGGRANAELGRVLRRAEAHSTLSLDGVAPARIVSGGTARRLFGEAMVHGATGVELRRADAGDATWRGLRAVHDGYRAAGVRHERVLMLRDGGTRLNGTDRMLRVDADGELASREPAADMRTGGARRTEAHETESDMPAARLRFHLHPAVRVTRDDAGVVLEAGEETWRFTADTDAALEETLFCDGRPVPSTQIVLTLGGPRGGAEWSFEGIDPGTDADADADADAMPGNQA